jgi:hypothetical protein
MSVQNLGVITEKQVNQESIKKISDLSQKIIFDIIFIIMYALLMVALFLALFIR